MISNSSFQASVDRARKGDFREYWLYQYIKANFKKLGFDIIDGPFDKGYDFRGVYKGRDVIVEVESKATNFILHKHDPGEVDILITLYLNDDRDFRGQKPEEWKKKLPPKAIIIDHEDFVRCTHEERKDYAQGKQAERDAFMGLLPLTRIKNAFGILWELFFGATYHEGTPEIEAFESALTDTALEYIKASNLNLNDLRGKAIITNIEVLANDLIMSKKKESELTKEEKSLIEYWIHVLQSKFST